MPGHVSRVRRHVVLAVTGAVAIAIIFVLLLRYRIGGQTMTIAIDDVLLPLVAFAAGASSLRWALRLRGAERFGWALVAASCAAWGFGEAIWGYYDEALHISVPFPSLADAGYLVAVPLGIIGILLFRSFTEGFATELKAVIDGLIIAASLFVVSWSTVLGSVYQASADTPMAKAISIYYPVGDVVMLTMVAIVFIRTGAWHRWPLALLAAGVTANAVTDSAFAYFTARGLYATGDLLDAGWLVGYLLIGLAPLVLQATYRSAGRLRLPTPSSGLTADLPIVLALVAIIIEAFADIKGSDGAVPSAGLVVIAVLMVVRIVIARLSSTSVEARQLTAFHRLADSEQRLWEVASRAPFGIFATDADGTLSVCVGAVMAKFHPSPQSLVGGPATELLTESPLRTALATALAGSPATAIVDRDNAELECSIAPTHDARNRLNGVIAVVTDVGEYRKAAAARRVAEDKSRFMSLMSHELRTPLNSVLGYAELLALTAEGLSEKQQGYVRNLGRGGQMLLSLVNDVLDLAKVEAGRMEFVTEDFDACSQARDALDDVHPQASAKKIELTLDAGVEVRCRADGRRTHQVLLNLLSNAIKFTPDGRRITLAVRAAGPATTFEVVDEGSGIPAEKLERIFEEFAQVAEPGDGAYQGTGLGLPLSRGLARAMGGDIDVRSTLGIGSTFTLSLPGQPATKPTSSAAAVRASAVA